MLRAAREEILRQGAALVVVDEVGELLLLERRVARERAERRRPVIERERGRAVFQVMLQQLEDLERG